MRPLFRAARGTRSLTRSSTSRSLFRLRTNADARIERQIVVGRGELVAVERLAASGRLPVECVAVPARQTAAYVAVGSAADRGAGAAAREHGHDEAGEEHPPIHDRTKYPGVTAGWVGRRGSASGPPSTGAITGWAMAWACSAGSGWASSWASMASAGSMRTSTARITPSSPAPPRAGR